MWAEAILTRDDLAKVMGDFSPVTLRLGGECTLSLREPSDVTLLVGRGLRVGCKAELHWPVAGIVIPVRINSLVIDKPTEGDRLVFKLELEHVDFAHIPSTIDEHLTERLKGVLAAKHVELSWNFSETLTHIFAFPPHLLGDIGSIGLQVAWGEVRVTEEALVLAVSFNTQVHRLLPASPPVSVAMTHVPAEPTNVGPGRSSSMVPRRSRGMALGAAFTALAVGAAYVIRRTVARRRSVWARRSF